ncbi:hypothetical protein C7967_11550 [Thalassospira sp. 11-3]|nr:hypothetical protein C7967_11550 [Thalassospira sp. 11-3]
MAAFNVNMDGIIKLTSKLERLNRSAFPVAVRQTLNNAAFTTKELVPKVAAQKFTTRQNNFFRAFSVVDKATGFNVNNMRAVAGINAAKGDKVADGLEQQETGGVVEGRKLIPHNMGRISGAYGKKLKAKNRFRNIKVATKGKRVPGAKHVLIKKGGRGTVFEIKRLKTKTKLTPIYSYRNTNKSRVAKTPFMAPSAMLAAARLPQYYQKNAENQFKRMLQ